MTVTQERNLKVNFAEPYIVVGQTILLSKKHEGAVTSYKDLNDPKFTVTSKLGTTGEQAIKRLLPNATYKSFENEISGGHLAAGRASARGRSGAPAAARVAARAACSARGAAPGAPVRAHQPDAGRHVARPPALQLRRQLIAQSILL